MVLYYINHISIISFYRWNQTPLSEAMRHRNFEVVKFLKEFINNNPEAGHDNSPYENENGVTAV